MRYILLCVTLLLGFNQYAQVETIKRLEFEEKDGYSGGRILEFGSNGFVLLSKKNERVNNQYEWKYDLYNSDLELKESKKVYVPKGFYLTESFENEQYSFSLYKNKKGLFHLITLDSKDLEVEQVKGILPKKAYIRDMAVLGDNAYFNATVKGLPYIAYINWKTGEQHLAPIQVKNFSSKSTSINNFQLLEEEREILVYVSIKLTKKTKDLYVVRLDAEGEQTMDFNLTKSMEQNIVSITGSKTDEEEYVFTGTYGIKTSTSSEGIFFCTVRDNEIDQINFYLYTELEDFLDYLPAKKIAKIEKKKSKAEKRGKEYKLNYLIATHKIIKNEEGYMLLGEAYYPTYRQEAYTTTVNGQTTTSYRTVFDGFQYTHAFLASFSFEGELQWDRTFKMWQTYKPYYVKKFISVAEQEDEDLIKLVYTSYNRIVSKTFDLEGNVEEEMESEPIQTKYGDDEVKRSFSNMDYWYDNYFIAYGMQRIKNKSKKGGKRKRTIFFISKIQY